MRNLLSTINNVIKNHYFILGWIIIAVSLWMQQNHSVDLYIQSFFFSNDSGWIVDNSNGILKTIFYSGSKDAIVLITLILIYFSFRSERPSKIKKTWAFLFCMTFIPTIIAFLKYTSGIHCPDELIDFHGKIPFRAVFDFNTYRLFFENYGNGNCFPGGHASGGFAMMSSFLVLPDRFKKKAIASGFLLGSFMSLYQMMKGAHFLSHNLFTLGFSLIVIASVTEFCSGD